MTVNQKYKIPAKLKQRVEGQIKLKEDLYNIFLTVGYSPKEAERLSIEAIYLPKRA
jgi:hypothetical protein